VPHSGAAHAKPGAGNLSGATVRRFKLNRNIAQNCRMLGSYF